MQKERVILWSKRVGLTTLIVAFVLLLLYVTVLPIIARSAVKDVLASLGMPDATLEVRGTSLSGLQVVNVADPDDRLRIGSIDVRYSLGMLLDGRVRHIELTGVEWNLHVKDGVIDAAPFDAIQPSGEEDTPLPFETLRIESSLVVIDWDGYALRVPVEATLTVGEGGRLDLDAGGDLAGVPVYASAVVGPTGKDGRRDVSAVLRSLGAKVVLIGEVNEDTGDIELKAEGMTDVDRPRQVHRDVSGEPFNLEATYRRRAGRQSFDVRLDAQGDNFTLGTGPVATSVGHGEVHGRYAVDEEGRVSELSFTTTVRDLSSPKIDLESCDIDMQQDGDRVTASFNVAGSDWSVVAKADLPVFYQPTGPSTEHKVVVSWDAEGRLPRVLLDPLTQAGIDLRMTGVARSRGRLVGTSKINPSAEDELDAWQVEFAELRAAVNNVNLLVDSPPVELKSLTGQLNLSGQLSPRGLVLVPVAATSGFEFESCVFGDLDETPLVLGASRWRIGTDAPSPSLGLRWDRSAKTWSIGSTLSSDDPLTFENDTLKASVKRFAVAGMVTVSPTVRSDGRKGKPHVALRSGIDIVGGEFDFPGIALRLSGVDANIPIVQNVDDTNVGQFSIKQITYEGQNLRSASGKGAIVDGVVDALATWPLLESATGQLSTRLDLTKAAVIGPLEFRLGEFELTANDYKLVEAIVPALKPLQFSGPMTLDGRINFHGGGATPHITLGAKDVTMRSDQYDINLEGINGEVTLDGFTPMTTPGTQRFSVETLRIGALELNDGELAFRVDGADSIFVERTRWNWGDNGKFWVHAFRYRTDTPEYDLQVFIEELDLSDYLTVATRGKVTGQGKLYGRIPVTIRPNEQRRIVLGRGFLYSQPEPGKLSVRDRDFAEPILRRFINPDLDQAVRQELERILLEGVSQFQYTRLSFDFIPVGLDTRLVATINGFGGPQKQLTILDDAGFTMRFENFGTALNERLITSLGSEEAIANELIRILGPR